MEIGYVRVSTEDQNLDRQIDALLAHGIDRRHIYEEKFTGTSLNRPVLQRMLEGLRPGDTVVVTDLSRISRSRNDLMELIERIGRQGASLRSLSDSWFRMDAGDAFYKLLLDFVLSVNEFERNLLAQRTREGLAAARERGKQLGRPRGIDPTTLRKVQAIRQLIASEGIAVGEACRTFGVPRCTYYRYLKALDTHGAV